MQWLIGFDVLVIGVDYTAIFLLFKLMVGRFVKCTQMTLQTATSCLAVVFYNSTVTYDFNIYWLTFFSENLRSDNT